MKPRYAEAREALEAHRRERESRPPVLFDGCADSAPLPTVTTVTNAAIAAVADTYRGEVFSTIVGRVERLARERESFTADDVHAMSQLGDIDMRVLGAVLRDVRKRGLISAGPYVPSARRHGSPIVEWRSEVHRAE